MNLRVNNVNKKRVLFSECAYVLGIVTLAFGTAFMQKANFGMSMVVAPAYLIHLKMSQYFGWFTFGVAEYCFQAVLLIVIGLLLRKFKPIYLFSFGTTLIYGLILDLCVRLVGLVGNIGMGGRVAFYCVGLLFCAVGISLLFHTYIAPEAYELFVKEVSAHYQKEIHTVKTVYDCSSCVLSIVMSFAFFGFGHFEGVKFGTIICAVVNGWLIKRISIILERHFDFKDRLKLSNR